MSGSYIGPVLPPGFVLPSEEKNTEDEVTDSAVNGLSIPINDVDSQESTASNEQEDISLYGPVLPPGLRCGDGSSIIGPTLPPQFKKADKPDPTDSDSEEEDVIGPLQCEAVCSETDSQIGDMETIEKRAQKMKDRLLGKTSNDDVPQVREEWMMELPTNLGRKIGLGPRTFSRKVAPEISQEDRSAWTDTPADSERKLKGKKSEAKKQCNTSSIAEDIRNQELSEQLENFNKTKRKESLLDLHKKKRKKLDEKHDPKKDIRKAFDRETDLAINRLDPSKTKRVIDGAKHLNGRFSHGSSHFL